MSVTLTTLNTGTKAVTFECFELLEADGGGVRDNRVALIADKAEGERWVAESKGYRTCRQYKWTTLVYANLAALKADQQEAIRQQALAKLTAQECAALGF